MSDVTTPVRCPRCGAPMEAFVSHVGSVHGPRRTRFECVVCEHVTEYTEGAPEAPTP